MDVKDDQSGMTPLHLPQGLPGSVGGAVIDHDNLQPGIVLGQQGGQGRTNGLCLIAGRDDNGDQRDSCYRGRHDVAQAAEPAAAEDNLQGQPSSVRLENCMRFFKLPSLALTSF